MQSASHVADSPPSSHVSPAVAFTVPSPQLTAVQSASHVADSPPSSQSSPGSTTPSPQPPSAVVEELSSAVVLLDDVESSPMVVLLDDVESSPVVVPSSELEPSPVVALPSDVESSSEPEPEVVVSSFGIDVDDEVEGSPGHSQAPHAPADPSQR